MCEFGSKLLDDKAPSHDMLGVESLARQILVVSEGFNWVVKEDVAMLLEHFHDG